MPRYQAPVLGFRPVAAYARAMIADDLVPDDATRRTLARLTEKEKDCLRRRLRHQTAKEIALDLGISPHAVEKRLKVARAKLGVSSSLDAARLLEAAEGYGRLGPQSPDLAHGAHDDPRPAGRFWLAGGILMSLIIATALALALQASGSAPAERERNERDNRTSAQKIEAVVNQNFANLDRDHSGFIELGDVPAPDGGRQFIAMADKNGDGKLDLAEYRGWAAAITAKRGAETRRQVVEQSRSARD